MRKNMDHPQSYLEWYTLFDTLFRPLNVTFNVSVEQNDIVLHASESDMQRIVAHLKLALADAGNFNHYLPYQVGDKKAPSQPKAYQQTYLEVPVPQDTIDSGKAILAKIFGFVFKQIGFDSNILFDENATVNNGVLWSKPIEKWLKDIWLGVVKATVTKYDGANVEVFRRAWHGDYQDLQGSGVETNDVVLARGQLQQIMGFTEDKDINENDRCRIFFDFGRAHQMLFPPVMQDVTCAQDEDGFARELRFSQAHFMTYLQMLIEDGVLFRMYRNANDARNIHASPLFLTTKDMVDLQNLVVLVIDCSGSMNADLPRLTDQVKHYIDDLRVIDPEARIRIIPFHDYVFRHLECAVSHQDRINDFLDKLRADCSTALYKTIDEELEGLMQRRLKNNTRMVIFTDGQDNQSGHDWSYFGYRIEQKIALLNKESTLQVFPVGAGDVNTSALQAMANTCGTPYVYCQNASDLGASLQDVVRTAPLKKFLDFMVTLRDSTQTFKMPIPQHGCPHMPDVSFVMLPSEQMHIKKGENDELCFTVYDVDQIPQATLVDQLRELKREALTIARNRRLSHDDRIGRIQQVADKISSLKVGQAKQSESMLVANVKYDVQGYIKQLERAKQNSHFAASAQTFFSASSGVVEIDDSTKPALQHKH